VRVPRARFTIRTTLISLASIGIGISALIGPFLRARRSAINRAYSQCESDYARACVQRIPKDVARCLLCIRWAAEGRKAPSGFVNNTQVAGTLINQDQFYRKLVMEMWDADTPQTVNRNFLGWTGESMWWAREVWRDAVRAQWHAVMSSRYGLAANNPTGVPTSEPPEPYPDE
jgi:hypothetical protein